MITGSILSISTSFIASTALVEAKSAVVIGGNHTLPYLIHHGLLVRHINH